VMESERDEAGGDEYEAGEDRDARGRGIAAHARVGRREN
jgi:hypothetical protein